MTATAAVTVADIESDSENKSMKFRSDYEGEYDDEICLSSCIWFH